MRLLWLAAVPAALGLNLFLPLQRQLELQQSKEDVQWHALQARVLGPGSADPPGCLVGPPHHVGNLGIEDALLALAVMAIGAGVLATFLDQMYDPEDKGCWYRVMETTIGYSRWLQIVLTCSVITATFLDWFDMITDVLVVVSYAECGRWTWFVIGITILVASTVYIAHNATLVESHISRPARFMMAVFQLDLLVEGIASVRHGRKSIHFARSKFLEGLLESCPQAFLSMYVLYAMHAESHFWLVLSSLVSVLSLAYGLSEWLEIGVDESTFLHTFWYHHLCRTAYFAVDFTLRLLTVTLVLYEPALHASGAVVFPAVLLGYVLIISAYSSDPATIVKAVFLTFFINLLPAELRRREGKERFLYLLEPDLRRQLHNPVLLMRILEFSLLSALIVYVASLHHPRRSIMLGTLLVAEVMLVWMVRLMTQRLEAQHDQLRRQSSMDLSAEHIPEAKESAV